MNALRTPKEADRDRARSARALRKKRIFWLIFAAALAFQVLSRFWQQPSASDHANWDYMAQVIARGGVPYRDAVNIKTPLSAYISAAGIVLARPFGLRDVFAIRIVYAVLGALAVGMAALVTLEYFGDLRIALLAAAVLLALRAFIGANSAGTQPKTPMILFGLLSLRAIYRDRPVEAGVTGMLSALCWQPGLLFVGTAGLAFSRYLTSWRDLKAAKVLAGATVPLAATIGYFWMAGALRDFYIWTIEFNFTVYAPGESRSLADSFSHIAEIINGTYPESLLFFYLAIAGLLITGWTAVVRMRVGGFTDGARKHGVLLAPVVYFAFCMVNVQGRADLIPLLPFVAAFAAAATVFIVRRPANLILRMLPKLRRDSIEKRVGDVLIVFILLLAVRGLLTRQKEFPTLRDQDREIASIVPLLQPGDKVFTHGRTEVLVLAGLVNASRHFLLDRGKDDYLDQVEPGGFDGWLDRLKRERPKIILLSRPSKVSRMKDLEQWVLSDYVPRQSPIFDYWIRKDDAQSTVREIK